MADHNRFGGAPRLQHYDTKWLMDGRQGKNVASMISVDEVRVIRPNAGHEFDGRFQLVLANIIPQLVGILRLCFRPHEQQKTIRSPRVQPGEGFEERELVFLRVNAADIHHEKRRSGNAVLAAKRRAIAAREFGGINSVGEVGDAVVGNLFAGFVEFGLAHADDVIGVFEDAPRG